MKRLLGLGHGKAQSVGRINSTAQTRLPISGLDASTRLVNQGNTVTIGGSSNQNTFHYGPNIYVGQQTSQYTPEVVSFESIPRSYNAEYDVIENVIRGPCTPETRIDVLDKLIKWCKSEKVQLYWMSGIAGTGKTTIAYSFCEMMKKQKRLGASFFCSRSLPDCRDVKLILPTICYHLAQRYSGFKQALKQVLKADPDIFRKSLDAQLCGLIIEPWKAKKWRLPRDVVVVLDALDECDSGHSTFLKALFDNVANLPFKILITSRPDYVIRDSMRAKDPSTLSTFILHEVEDDLVQADITKYLNRQLAGRAPPDVIQALVEISGTLFIVAVTLARWFLAGNVDPRTRLNLFKTSSPTQYKVLASLDDVYKGVLCSAFQEEELMEVEVKGIKDVLFTVACAREPLSLEVLADLCMASTEEVDRRLDSLHSILSISNDRSRPITVIHASFIDFMRDPIRSGEFCCHPGSFNVTMTTRCLALLESQLRRNLCNLTGMPPNESIDPSLVEAHIKPSLRYAAIHWVEHLVLSNRSERLVSFSSMHGFLASALLYWVECLSLLRQLVAGIHSLEIILEEVTDDVGLIDLTRESLRFIQQSYDVISYNPMQTYFSALVWIPAHSPLRNHYATFVEHVPRILCGLPTCWAGPERVVEVGNYIHSISVLRDGKRITSGCRNGTLHLWNLHHHFEECVLTGHAGSVHYVAAFGDGVRILSRSRGGAMHIWNTEMREVVATLEPPFDSPAHVAVLSSDDDRIASSHRNGFICIWDAKTGVLIQSFKGPDILVRSIAFIPNSLSLAMTDENTARIWNVSTGQPECSLHGHTHLIHSVASLPDGNRIVTGSADNSARMWNISGDELQVFRGHLDSVNRVDVLPNGKHIITSSWDKTLRIWDVITGASLCVFSSTGIVQSLAVFPDSSKVASSSESEIAIWNIKEEVAIGEERSIHESVPLSKAESMALSSNGRRALLLPALVILDTATLEEKVRLVPQGINYNCGAWSTSATKVAAAAGRGIEMWELVGDNVIGDSVTLLAGTSDVCYIAFSQDECLLISITSAFTARVWDVTDGSLVCGLRHQDPVYGATFSNDNTKILTATNDSVYVWDSRSGEKLYRIFTPATSVMFTPDDRHITISRDSEATISIWNAQTREREHKYHGFRCWTTFSDGSSYMLSKDSWVCYLDPLDPYKQPRKILWIPSAYRPSQSFQIHGPIFTSCEEGLQVCLPRERGLVTLIIPRHFLSFSSLFD